MQLCDEVSPLKQAAQGHCESLNKVATECHEAKRGPGPQVPEVAPPDAANLRALTEDLVREGKLLDSAMQVRWGWRRAHICRVTGQGYLPGHEL